MLNIICYMSFFDKILDIVFPKNFKCIFCGDEISATKPPYVCDKCLKSLPFIKGKICLRCGEPIFSMSDYCIKCKDNIRFFNVARAPFVYDKPISTVIHGFKYNNQKYTFESLAKFMANCYLENDFDAQVIIPVPISQNRLKERGYNQAELLCRQLANQLNLPLQTDVLVKIKHTKPQTTLNYHERQKNLMGSFDVQNVDKIKGKNVLVVDDVLTTGATINCCSELLKLSKVNKVFVLTLARTQSEHYKKALKNTCKK